MRPSVRRGRAPARRDCLIHTLNRLRARCTPLHDATRLKRSLCRQFLGLRDPSVHAPWKPHFFTDAASGLGPQSCNLPEMKNTEIVELLFDRRGHVMEFLEVVRNAAWPGQYLVAGPCGRGGQLFRRWFGCCTGINPKLPLRA